MKKIIVIPDSFKGTLSSCRVADIMKTAVHEEIPAAEVVSIPVADGGEGTVDAFLLSLGGEKIELTVMGPLFEPVKAFYGKLPDSTAVIEMAAAAGLPLVGKRRLVGEATTYGVGELMKHAIEKGARHIILGLGGSATNDGGCGAAAALGIRFFDEENKEFVPTGATLRRVHHIDASGSLLKNVRVTIMCDIDNPLCGPKGAAAVFGPQKGADEAMVRLLDAGLENLAKVIKADLGKEVAEIPGAGAAGGMGAGAAAFFEGSLTRGIDVVLETVDFKGKLEGADAVFTGEGCFDEQSFMGKVVSGVAGRAKEAKVPVIVVAGAVKCDEAADAMRQAGVTAAFSINRQAMPFAEAAPKSAENLRATMGNILRLLAL